MSTIKGSICLGYGGALTITPFITSRPIKTFISIVIVIAIFSFRVFPTCQSGKPKHLHREGFCGF